MIIFFFCRSIYFVNECGVRGNVSGLIKGSIFGLMVYNFGCVLEL